MVWLAAACLAAAGLSAAPVVAQQGAENGEWQSYAGDAWGTKYAPLDQITGENFGSLELAWGWRSADTHLPHEDDQGISLIPAETLFDRLEAANPDLWQTRPTISRLSATPLMVDGILYLATPLYQAAAIDARTGETLWVHNPRVYEAGSPSLPMPWNHRGVAYWEDPATGDARIVWGTGDGYLTAVDARTGLLASNFGTGGRVSVEAGIPRARENPSRMPPPSRSPPLVVGDTIVVGSSVHDYLSMKENAPGFARAYDARTGRHLWDFHTVPQSTARRPGRTMHGVTRVTPISGGTSPPIRSWGTSTLQAARPPRTTTAGIASATTCSPRASSASTSKPASASGTTSLCTTVSGTTTTRPDRT